MLNNPPTEILSVVSHFYMSVSALCFYAIYFDVSQPLFRMNRSLNNFADTRLHYIIDEITVEQHIKIKIIGKTEREIITMHDCVSI